MDLGIFIPIIIAIFFLVWLLNRKKIRLWSGLLMEKGLKGTFHLEKCHRIFNKLYENVSPMSVSLKEREEKDMKLDVSYTYGEVTFYSFASILDFAKPQPGEVFYDLGSGGGKAVFIAALAYDFSKTCGIEKLDGLYHLSLELTEKLKNMPELKQELPNKKLNIEFRKEDFLNCDFSDADIIFMSATCFRGDLWDSMIAKLTRLKKGTRIILGSKTLDLAGFELIHSNLFLMSWGMNSVYIYKKL